MNKVEEEFMKHITQLSGTKRSDEDEMLEEMAKEFNDLAENGASSHATVALILSTVQESSSIGDCPDSPCLGYYTQGAVLGPDETVEVCLHSVGILKSGQMQIGFKQVLDDVTGINAVCAIDDYAKTFREAMLAPESVGSLPPVITYNERYCILLSMEGHVIAPPDENVHMHLVKQVLVCPHFFKHPIAAAKVAAAYIGRMIEDSDKVILLSQM